MTFRPIAKIVQKSDEDGWHCSNVIEYRCPICYKILKGYKKQDGCIDCNIFFNWGDHEPKIVVTKNISW